MKSLKKDAVDIMCKVDEVNKNYITYEKENKVIYMKVEKALYCCVQSALLWWNTFKSKLEQMGFKLNPYEPCIANKEINNKWYTICWCVDDMKFCIKIIQLSVE